MNENSLKELKSKLSEFKKDANQTKRVRSTKIGILFDEINHFLTDPPNGTIELLNSKLKNTIEGGNPRKNVISQLLKYLNMINVLSEKPEDAKFISIPLYDMKIIGKLLNLIIVHGVYEIIPSRYLIPLENRRLKDFRMINKLVCVPLDGNKEILEEILETFNEIFSSNSDLKDLILVGVGLTDMLNICLVLYLTQGDEKYLNNLNILESYSSTYQLISFYTLLMNYSGDQKLKMFLRGQKLPSLIMKPNGVESLIDLILGLRENEEIDTSRIRSISAILLNSKPSGLSEEVYFKCVCDQLFNSLVFVNRPIMTTVIVELLLLIINSGYESIIEEYIFKRVWKSFNPEPQGDDIILTSGIELNNAFNVILSIVRCLKQSDQGILFNFLGPIVPQIWWFANYQRQKEKDSDIVLNLLKNSILLDSKVSLITSIIDNIIKPITLNWGFIDDEESAPLTMIKFDTHESTSPKMLDIFSQVDSNIETFIILVKKIVEVDEARLNEIMVIVLNKSIGSNVIVNEEDDDDLPLVKLINLKLLQTMIESFRDEIEKSPIVILSFIDDLLTRYFQSVGKSKLLIVKEEEVDSDDEDGSESDSIQELTSLIPIFELIGDWKPRNEDEQQKLMKLQSKIKLNASLIPLSLQHIIKKIIDIDTKSIIKGDVVDDDLKLETILKQLNDQSPSIKVFALDELVKLTISSDKISCKYTINLMINQLKDNEPFVYLNAIKNISKLLQFDKSQLDPILEIYGNGGKLKLDERLRLAESINKFIENKGKSLSPVEINNLVTTFTQLVKPQEPEIDSRIRMSSLSLLGCVCHDVGLGILDHIDEIIDIIKGVMTFEKDQPEIRRASIVIVNDIVGNEYGLEIIKKFGPSIETMLKYVNEFDQDLLVTQLAWDTLVGIDEAFERKLTL